MPASQRVAHLRRVQSEATARRDAQLSLQTQEVEDLVSAMFASTLSDAGPDLNTQSSRLWSSRNDLQPSSPPSSVHPSISSAPTTEAILGSIRRLQRAPETGTADLMADTLPSPDVYDTTPSQSQRTESKRERSTLTKKAHKILELLDDKANRCLVMLSSLELAPDYLLLASLEREIAELQRSIDNVKRSVHSLNQRKGPLRDKLEGIQSRFTKLCAQHPAVHDGPLHYDNGKLLLIFAQSLFLTLTFYRPSLSHANQST
jgi:hypothetical protein